METLELDGSLLSSDSNEISRRSFVNLGNFRNQKYLKTKFHKHFMTLLQNVRLSNRTDFSVSGITGIGKTFTLVYFMLDCLKKKDESVHYIDLKKSDFKIETFLDYAKRIKEDDLIIIDHVTLFNKHHIADFRKLKDILILTVETGFTASNYGEKFMFGKNSQLDEEEFNQMWIAQPKLENYDLSAIGREVYKEGVLNGLPTPRLLHTFFFLMHFAQLSLSETVQQYILQQRKNIDDLLTSDAGEEYQMLLVHSRILLHYLNEDHDIILTQRQYEHMRIAANIFDVQSSCVTKENLEQDSRFLELGLEETNNYYRVSHLVSSFADYWRQRLPYHFEMVLESTDFKNLVNIFQCGGGRKEIEKMVVEVQKKHYITLAPFTAVPNTTYEESENDCFIPQVELQLKQLSGEVYTVKSYDLQDFSTKFVGHAKNVAQCAMWIKKKVKANPNHDFILHPDISNLMGVTYFCKTRHVKEGTVKKPKYEYCLFLVQVAPCSSHNGKTVGEALTIVKEVLAEVDLTIHLVVAIVVESQSSAYCLRKSSFQNASAINLANRVFIEMIKHSFVTLYDFVMRVKSWNDKVVS